MKKYKIGYTTGVFDLFHIGHLNILRRAKEQCDFLIVGVSTDELVKEYKSKVPVIPFNERMEIVDAIKYVDKVVPQENMDKFAAWEVLHFEALFHGDDWKNSKMYKEYENQFAAVGVDIVYLPHTKGTSSTEVAMKLKD
ncbi:MAG: adenylyltransferase/cytidyltransferase family protein [Clostridia bacterium]|nr:adenylyltransferase/cytidyltransferase family protein [Clostridia bacterium]